MDKRRLGGFVTERGASPPHAVILAKTLGIPAVVVRPASWRRWVPGASSYLDGGAGPGRGGPDTATREAFLTAKEREETQRALWAAAARERAITRDGHAVAVCVNSGDTESLKAYDSRICDGIGLFRTEFLFMDQKDYPDEELQYAAYRFAAEAARGEGGYHPHPGHRRGQAAGGYMDLPQENNPFLGYRAIRLCLDRKEIFRTQLRAILRASAHGNLKIMFPHDRHAGGAAGGESPGGPGPGGAGRGGPAPREKGAHGHHGGDPRRRAPLRRAGPGGGLFSPSAPTISSSTPPPPTGRTSGCSTSTTPCNLSVLRSIHMVIQNGHAAGIPVGMCGEAASDDRLVPLLLAMGLDEFSVVPAQVGKVKHMVRSADFAALAPWWKSCCPSGKSQGAKAPAGAVLTEKSGGSL